MKLNTPDLIGSRIILCDTLVPLKVNQGKACHVIQYILMSSKYKKSLFSGIRSWKWVN